MRVIVTTSRLHKTAWDRLKALAEIRQTDDQAALEELFATFDPHAILSRTLEITARAIDSAPSLRVISKHGAGTDNIDIDAATRRGIPVFFSRGANARSVAEHAIGLAFALARNVARHDRGMRDGAWTRFSWPAHELAGKRIGIVGLGQSGRIVADLAHALQMEVAFFDPWLKDDAHPDWAARFHALGDMLGEADIVTLHCPLTPETRRLMNAATFGAMKRGAWLINTARGSVVDETDLMEALRSGQLGGAGLDCFSAEPLPPGHPLLESSNVVLTAHVAGSTLQSAHRVARMAVDNILNVMNGAAIDRNAVMNPEVLKA